MRAPYRRPSELAPSPGDRNDSWGSSGVTVGALGAPSWRGPVMVGKVEGGVAEEGMLDSIGEERRGLYAPRLRSSSPSLLSPQVGHSFV